MTDEASESSPVQPAIVRPSLLPARDRGGGARTVPLITRALGAKGFISGITIFDPGAEVALHSHNCEESVVILEGHAVVEIAGVEHNVGPDDTTFLPAHIPHRFRNASQNARLRILWTYASVDATRTLIASGVTRSIAAEHGDEA